MMPRFSSITVQMDESIEFHVVSLPTVARSRVVVRRMDVRQTLHESWSAHLRWTRQGSDAEDSQET